VRWPGSTVPTWLSAAFLEKILKAGGDMFRHLQDSCGSRFTRAGSQACEGFAQGRELSRCRSQVIKEMRDDITLKEVPG